MYAGADGTLRAVADFTPLESDPIYHDEDGTKTISLKFTLVDLVISSVGFNGDNNNYTEKTIELTNIPRASTIAATDANIESVSQITINRKSVAYNHTVKYSFGDISGYIDSDGNAVDFPVYMEATSIAFTVPESFYEQIPDDPSGVCSLTVSTYSIETGVKIGDDKLGSFTATAERARCSPLLSGTIVDINPATTSITDKDTDMIRYMSNAKVVLSVEPKNFSTIKSKSIGGVTVDLSEDNRIIEKFESPTVVISVTDSRDYTTTITLGADSFTLIPYMNLTCNMDIFRDDPTSGDVTMIVSGKYYNNTFGSVDNELSIIYKIGNDGENVVAVHDGVSTIIELFNDSYKATLHLTGLSYDTSHKISVTASDKLMSAYTTGTVSKGIPNFDMGESDINFNVSANFSNTSKFNDTVEFKDATFSDNVDFNSEANFNGDVSFANKNNVVKSLLCNGASNGDFNDILDHGIYWMELENCVNGPSTSGLGFLEVVKGFADATSGVLQKFTYYDTLAIAVRTYFNDVWTDWDFIADTRSEVVWTNASPTSTFASQTIELDLSSYDEVEIYAYTSNSSVDCVIRKCIVSEAGSGTQLSVDVNYTSSSNTQVTRVRKITVSYTGIEFGKAYSKDAGTAGDTASSSSYIIPYEIRGIRRVKVT